MQLPITVIYNTIEETTGVLGGREAIYKTRLEENETFFHLEQQFKTIADSLSRVALDCRIWGSLFFFIPHFLETWAIMTRKTKGRALSSHSP